MVRRGAPRRRISGRSSPYDQRDRAGLRRCSTAAGCGAARTAAPTSRTRACQPNGGVFSIADEPGGRTMYAGCEQSAAVRSRDGSTSWEEDSPGCANPLGADVSFLRAPRTSHVHSIAPAPHDANRLPGRDRARSVILEQREDGGTTWKDRRPGTADCRALASRTQGGGSRVRGGRRGRGVEAATAARRGARPTRAAIAIYTWALTGSTPTIPSAGTCPPSPAVQAHGWRSAEAPHLHWRGRALGAAHRGLPDPARNAMPYAFRDDERRAVRRIQGQEVFRSDDTQRRPLAVKGRSALPRCSRSYELFQWHPRDRLIAMAELIEVRRPQRHHQARGRRDRQRRQRGPAARRRGRRRSGAPVAVSFGRSRTRSRADRARPRGGDVGEMPAKSVPSAATMELSGPTSAEIIRRATASTLARPTSWARSRSAWWPSAPRRRGFPIEEADRMDRGGPPPPSTLEAISSASCSRSSARRRGRRRASPSRSGA